MLLRPLAVLLAASGLLAGQPYAAVTEADLPGLKLNHYFSADKKSHQPDFAWTFTKENFTVKKGTAAIPADLLAKLLPAGAAADEITGKWKLDTKDGVKLVLTDIKAGDKDGNKVATFPIYRTAPTVVRIGEPQYVFATGG